VNTPDPSYQDQVPGGKEDLGEEAESRKVVAIRFNSAYLGEEFSQAGKARLAQNTVCEEKKR